MTADDIAILERLAEEHADPDVRRALSTALGRASRLHATDMGVHKHEAERGI